MDRIGWEVCIVVVIVVVVVSVVVVAVVGVVFVDDAGVGVESISSHNGRRTNARSVPPPSQEKTNQSFIFASPASGHSS